MTVKEKQVRITDDVVDQKVAKNYVDQWFETLWAYLKTEPMTEMTIQRLYRNKCNFVNEIKDLFLDEVLSGMYGSVYRQELDQDEEFTKRGYEKQVHDMQAHFLKNVFKWVKKDTIELLEYKQNELKKETEALLHDIKTLPELGDDHIEECRQEWTREMEGNQDTISRIQILIQKRETP